MENLIKRISDIGVVPVIKIDKAKDAVPLAAALKKGGLCCAEVTFRTDAAEEAIRLIAQEYPDFLVAAGTVLTPKQADAAMAAGASFIVSPGLNPIVVKHCIEKGYPIIPGVCTPSEVEQGMSLGLTYLKFFPAEAAGGLGDPLDQLSAGDAFRGKFGHHVAAVGQLGVYQLQAALGADHARHIVKAVGPAGKDLQPAGQIPVQQAHPVVGRQLHGVGIWPCGFFGNKNTQLPPGSAIVLINRQLVAGGDLQTACRGDQLQLHHGSAHGAKRQLRACVDAFCVGAALDGIACAAAGGELCPVG